MQSRATTVAQYLSELPEDRRATLAAVRKVILENLDRDYEEGMQYGMIGYYVPHRVFPPGYHCDPRLGVPFAGLASQKNYMSLYLMSAYADGPEERWLREAWARAGKKLDMGKCCIRFKKLEDLALEVIGEAVRRVPARAHIAQYESSLRTEGTARKKAAAGPARSKAPSRSRASAKPAKKSRPARKS